MTKTIIFDMGGVLINWNPALIVKALRLQPQEEALVLQEVLHSVDWIRLDRGSIGVEEGIASMCSRLPASLHGAVRKIVLGWWELRLVPVPGMEALIASLKQAGCQILLLSNAATTLRTYFPLIPGAQYFDGVYLSAEHHLLKPEREIFLDFLQVYGLQPEQCFFVDDNPANIEAAGQLGIAGAAFYGDTAALCRALQVWGIPCSLKKPADLV